MTDKPTPADTPTPRRTRRGGGGITLTDVAKLAGVAPITVSRALNTPDQVSPALLERVRDAVARTGYVPNRLAGGLASSRSRLIAAVVPSIAGPTFLDTVQSLTDTLGQAGYQVFLGQSGYTQSREDALLEQILGRRPDGIVLTGVVHSALLRRRLQAAQVPVVETWDLTPTPIDMLVGFSHQAAGAAVADFLHRQGHQRVAVVGADDARARQREAGFLARAQALGLRGGTSDGAIPALRVSAPTNAAHGRALLATLLEQAPQTQAVFCGSDMLALGVIMEAQARGLRIPDALAVVGFGDLSFASVLHPALTTVRIDSAAIGQQTAGFLLDRLEGRHLEPRVVDVGFELVARASA